MDGIEFLKKVRDIPEYIDVPVIFLSSVENSDIINTALSYKIIAWLKKPINTNQLITILKKLFP